MKNQSIFSSTLHCIFAGFFSGFLFNLLMIILIMFVSNHVNASTIHSKNLMPENMQQGSLLFHDAMQTELNPFQQQYTLAPTLDTDVHIQVTGMIVRTTVKQSFHNPGTDWKEGIYVFPLPEDAAVDQLRMHIGERIIEGQIREKQQAKKEYQTAKSSGKKASLVEQERPNIFTTSVANIAPDEKIIIEITYQHPVHFSDQRFSLRFPMVVAPRYIPGNAIEDKQNIEEMNIKDIVVDNLNGTGWAMNTNQVPDASRITPPVVQESLTNEEEIFNPVSIRISLDTGFLLNDITSTYHPIDVGIPEDTHYTIKLKQTKTPANRDFELVWQAEEKSTPQAALFTEEKDSEAYSLIMLLPPAVEQARSLNREIIFVIDTSGSMSGPSIVQAKQALSLALTRLKPGDRFNVIQFNSYTDKLFKDAQLVSHHALRQAKNYVNGLEAQGGTEMATALRAALQKNNSVTENTPQVRQVIFLTDGSVGNEDALFNIIQSQIANSRLFTIGIGSAPNSHFMNRAAKFGRGTHTYIGNVTEVQNKMAALFNKLENPVLTNIHIQWPDDLTVESWPQKIPDLYLGEPLLISTKSKTLPQSVIIRGDLAGKPWQTNMKLNGGKNNSGIPVIWARQKIAALMDQIRIAKMKNSPAAKQLQELVTKTALQHHLVSKFTSLVAIDVTPANIKQALLKTHALGVNLPHGWEYQKVFGKMPATATNASYLLFSGLLTLLLSIVLMVNRQRWFNV